MIEWMKQLRKSFGASFLWLVCLIYFTQGFKSFVWTAVSYQLKDKLKLSPSASQFVFSIAFFPWSIKPLYGILSDCIPIKGRKRIPYLMIATVLSLFPWIFLGLNSTLRSSKWNLVIFLTVQNLGSAMSDVVVDAMIAEAVRTERAAFAGDLQSISWLAMAFGGICGSLLGEENFVCGEPLLEFPDKVSSHLSNGNGSIKESVYDDKAKSNTKRRKKGQKKENTDAVITSKTELPEKDGPLALRWFHSFKVATYSLCRAFRQPMILRPMAWFFIAHVTIPNLSTVMFYYQTEFLELDASFLGTSRVVGWLGLMLGTFVYNRYLKKTRLRKILMGTHISLAFMSLLDVILISRSNLAFGISDRMMVLCGSALSDAINQFKFMPFLILSGKLCPPGIEGTLFALFMSINNLGSTIGNFVGAGLASLLNISSGSFDNLQLGVTIQVISNFIPVALLFLIPKEATGVSA